MAKIEVRISDELKEQLQSHCNENCINMSELIRRLIEKYLADK
ncbi:ribbon-helix-helix domain-containing protein [Sporomusa sphaeroides]|nr:ribbon-helix-helix domain-containing protein [Sporomusa sphaeroides]HML33838.1 ribbon-helix-helix domain-containing protein [Sporomusa sphaeroides]